MSETPFILLSQDDCPRCERLKAMLERPLRNKYQYDVTVVHRQREPELFSEVAARYGVRSTPVLIERSSGAVLVNTESLSTVNAFLSRARIAAPV